MLESAFDHQEGFAVVNKCSLCPAVVGCHKFEKQVTYLAFKSLLLLLG